MTRRAAFLDRDGTIIKDTGFVGEPESVELLPGVGAALKRLNAAGWPVVVVTNQSGIARGRFTQADYERVAARVGELLAAQGARLDATYVCPHHPSEQCACRKPGVLLYRNAAREHDLDLTGSWFVGDRLRDVQPAGVLGGRGILVPTAETSSHDTERARREFSVAGSLDEAVTRIIESAK